MRPCTLMFLLCTWACPLLVQARKFLFLAAPNVLQMDTDETIVIQAHEFQNAVDLIITVHDFPHKKNCLFSGETRLTEPNYLNMFTIKIPSANIKSEFEGEKQYVVVKAELKTDQSLSVEKAILISRSTGYIYIQTDKSIYTPAQTVLYRIFTTDHNMDPQSKPVLVELQNPSGVTVMQHSWQVEDGLITNSLQIPELASCGEWKIVASYQNDPDKKFTSEFEVKEYVLPSFEVQLTSKNSYFYVGDPEFTIDITARYVHNEEVQGYAFVTFSVIYQKKKYNLQNPLQRVEIDEGKGSATVTMKQLIDSFENNTNLVGASISVNVNVFSSGGDMVQAERSGIQIVESPYRIRSTQTPRYFKPGVPFQFSVVVTNPDESPVPRLLVICESTETSSRTNEDGVASITLNTGYQSRILHIQVKTSDSRLRDSQQASFSLRVKAYNTWRNSQNLLHIEANKLPQKLSLHMFTSHGPKSDVKSQLTYFTVLLVSKGNIFKVERQAQNTGASFTAMSIENTPHMWPSFRIVAYYYVDHGNEIEIVSDSCWVDMPDVCTGTLEIKTKDNMAKIYQPGESYSLELIADVGAQVGLLAVDKAVYALHKKNKLTQKKVWNTVEKNDIGCSYGSGENYLKVFEDAGMDIATSLGISTKARTELKCPSPLSRKRRALKNVELKNNKEDEYNETDRVCCRAGFRDNLMGLSCEQRKLHVNVALGEGCIKAFVDCCVFAEGLQPEIREELIWSKNDNEDVGWDEDEDEEEDEDGITIRTSFPESWMWHIITINNDPKKPESTSVVSVPLKGTFRDSITTWEIVAVSIRKDTGICVSNPLEMVVKKDFFVDLKLPYSVVRKEQIEIKAMLYNHRPDPQKAYVFFQYNENICSLATRSKGYRATATVPGYSTLAVPYVVIPLELGQIPIEVQVRVRYGPQDGIQKVLNVVPEGQLIRLSRSIMLHPEGLSQIENIQRQDFSNRVPNTEPENFISIQGDILGESLLGSWSESELSRLVHLPGGCPEQTLFSTTPNIIFTKYLDDTRQWDLVGADRRKEAITNIENGYNRQMTILLFPDNSLRQNTWLTAYMVKMYSIAYELMTVNAVPICKSVEWLLVHRQLSDGAFQETGQVFADPMKGEAKDSLTAYVLISLKKAEGICKSSIKDFHNKMQNAVKYLERRLPSLNTAYSTVIASYALALMGSPRADDVIDKYSTGQIYWAYNNQNESVYTVETTAYALLQKLQQKKIDEAHKIVEWLILRRDFGGGYSSTQTTAVTLEALAEYKKQTKAKEDPQLNVVLQIAGRQKTTKWTVRKENAYLHRSEKVAANKDIIVNATGTGTGTLTLLTVYRALPTDEAKKCKGFTLQVSLEPMENGLRKRGVEETFKLTIRARSRGDRDATMTIIDVKILTAFLPEESDLKRLTNNVENYISQYETQTTANNGSVILYLSKVSHEQETVISFSVYQTLKVELLQPAAVTIYEYYDTDKKCTTFYNVREESGMLRKLCQGSECKCAEGGCAVQKDAAAKLTPEDLNKAACEYNQETESTIDYVYRVEVNQTKAGVYDRHDMKILDIIKFGTDSEVKLNLVSKFYSHMTCREGLKLEEKQQYLIMGVSKDMWKLAEGWSYHLGSQSYILHWPKGGQELPGGSQILKTTLENFTSTFKEKGCTS
ncbi:complement C3-like [Lissotriton helveticus]